MFLISHSNAQAFLAERANAQTSLGVSQAKGAGVKVHFLPRQADRFLYAFRSAQLGELCRLLAEAHPYHWQLSAQRRGQ